jgi:hypothetical protein
MVNGEARFIVSTPKGQKTFTQSEIDLAQRLILKGKTRATQGDPRLTNLVNAFREQQRAAIIKQVQEAPPGSLTQSPDDPQTFIQTGLEGQARTFTVGRGQVPPLAAPKVQKTTVRQIEQERIDVAPAQARERKEVIARVQKDRPELRSIDPAFAGFSILSQRVKQVGVRQTARELGQGFGRAVGFVSDVGSAVTLRPASLFPTKETPVSGEELEKRSRGIRETIIGGIQGVVARRITRQARPIQIATTPKEFATNVLGRAARTTASAIPGVGAGITGVEAIGPAQIKSFQELRTFRQETQRGKEIVQERERQLGAIRERTPELERIVKQQTALQSEITAAGDLTQPQAEAFQKRATTLSQQRKQVLGELEETGVTIKDEKFTSRAFEADVRLGSIKQLEAVPTTAGRATRIGGALTSEAVKFVALGKVSAAAGVTGAIGKGIALLPKAGQVAVSVGTVGLIGTSATLKGVSAARAAPEGLKTEAIILGAGEPLTQVGAFAVGVKPGISPVQVRSVQIGESDVSGVFLKAPFATAGQGVLPVVTKATTVTAKGVATTRFGVGQLPKNFVVGTPQTQFTPSGNIETFIFKKGLGSLPKQDQVFVLKNLDVAKVTRGAKVPVVKKDVLQQSQAFKQLSPKGQKAFVKFVEKNTAGVFRRGRIFGSSASTAQLDRGLGRPVKDIDIRFESVSGAAKAKALQNILAKTEGASSVKVLKQGQVTITKNGVTTKLADLHGIEKVQSDIKAVENPFGFPEKGTVKIGKLNVNQLSQEGINKLASVGSLQPSGRIGPDATRRIKDVGDFFVIQESLAKTIGGAKGAKALANLQQTKTIALSKFGKDAFSGQQDAFLGVTRSISSSAVSPSVKATSTVTIPSLKVSVPKEISASSVSPSSAPQFSVSLIASPSPSLQKSPVISSSLSPQRSPSPSLQRSPSLSPSTQRSPSLSPSASPSPSISPSLSPSISPSISPSLSPSISPSLSPSPSPSPSITGGPVPVGGIGFPGLPFVPQFRRGPAKRRKKAAPVTRFSPSISGAVLGIRLTETPKELAIGGFDPFKIRGVVVKKKKKKKKGKKKKQ